MATSKLQCFIGLVIFILARSASADILVNMQNDHVYYAHIINTISKSDYDALVEKVSAIHGATVMFKLDSLGGNMEAAVKMGRFLRKRNALAFVDEGAVCMSSCVFILAGAAHRSIKGVVGIHRPYEPNDTNVSADAQKAKYAKLGGLVKKYLTDVNVQPKLYDDMLYIPPERVRILTNEDLSGYGLVGDDPYQDEANAADRAKLLGITRQEYAKRKVRIRNECPRITDNSSYDETMAYAHCYDDIEGGKK